MRIVPFSAEHLRQIELQPAQSHMIEALRQDGYGAMLENCTAFTAMDDAGKVLICAGFEERWEGCAQAWALLSCYAGRHMVSIVRALRGYIDHVAPWHRIESAVDVGFTHGERLLEMLGFEFEGLARAYRPDGGNCTIWAKIRSHDK